MQDNGLQCIAGYGTTYYYLDPQETTFILLAAKPHPTKMSNYFDPGHA